MQCLEALHVHDRLHACGAAAAALLPLPCARLKASGRPCGMQTGLAQRAGALRFRPMPPLKSTSPCWAGRRLRRSQVGEHGVLFA